MLLLSRHEVLPQRQGLWSSFQPVVSLFLAAFMYSRASALFWSCTTLPCLACRSFYQVPQHRLIAQHTAGACAEQPLAWLVWPGQSCYTAGLPLGECGEYIILTDLSPLHTCVHDGLWACLAPAQPGTCWFRWTFTVQDECRLALAFWRAIFSYWLLPFILNLCFGMPVDKFHWIFHLASEMSL